MSTRKVMNDLDFGGPAFRGTSAAECEAFIQSIRKTALSRERSRDNLWIAQYAASCFVGPALRWYERLEGDVQDDWNRLRAAMLERWPEDEDGEELGDETLVSSIIPTPAAASPPLPPQRLATNFGTENIVNSLEGLSLNTRQGVLRLVAPEGTFYVYQTRNSSGSFGTTARSEYALRVSYDVAAPPHRVRATNVDDCSWLALKWHTSVATAPGSTKPVGLVGLDDLGSFRSSDPNRRKWKGPHRSSVWLVSTDGTVHAVWEDGTTCVLSTLWRANDHLIMLVADPDTYVAKYPQWSKARLLIDPY